MTQTEVARRAGVGQSAISSLLSGRHRAGYVFARTVATLSGVSVDALLSGKPSATLAPPPWRTLPGFDETLAAAQQLFPHLAPDAWAWVGEIAGVSPPALTPVILGQLAQVFASIPPQTAEELPAKRVGRSGTRPKGQTK